MTLGNRLYKISTALNRLMLYFTALAAALALLTLFAR
jgi:hypothetical protein